MKTHPEWRVPLQHWVYTITICVGTQRCAYAVNHKVSAVLQTFQCHLASPLSHYVKKNAVENSGNSPNEYEPSGLSSGNLHWISFFSQWPDSLWMSPVQCRQEADMRMSVPVACNEASNVKHSVLYTHGSGVNLVVSSHRTVLTISFCVSFCSRQKKTPGLHLVCHIASQSLIYTWALMSLKKKCFLPRARNTVHLLLYLFWIQVSVLLKRSATVKHSPQHHYTCSLYKPLWDTAEVDWSQQKDGHWLPESLGCDVWAVWGLC